MPLLKLVALDQDDLTVISAHVQDAVLQVADLSYLPREKRFVAIVNRFDWTLPSAVGGKAARSGHQRRRCALRFEHVTAVRRQNIVQTAPGAVLSLLAVQFAETNAPSGHLTLVCSGGGAIRLEVDCIEAELRDLGPVWTTSHRPGHDFKDDAS